MAQSPQSRGPLSHTGEKPWPETFSHSQAFWLITTNTREKRDKEGGELIEATNMLYEMEFGRPVTGMGVKRIYQGHEKTMDFLKSTIKEAA